MYVFFTGICTHCANNGCRASTSKVTEGDSVCAAVRLRGKEGERSRRSLESPRQRPLFYYHSHADYVSGTLFFFSPSWSQHSKCLALSGKRRTRGQKVEGKNSRQATSSQPEDPVYSRGAAGSALHTACHRHRIRCDAAETHGDTMKVQNYAKGRVYCHTVHTRASVCL